jgi:hypothetical protein
LLLGAAGAAVVVLGLFTLAHLLPAAAAGTRGRAALTRAEANLSARNLDAARQDLDAAEAAFAETQAEMSSLGIIAKVARRIPILGDQVKAVDTFAGAGLELSAAAQPLVDAADAIVNPANEALPISAAMDALRTTQQSLVPAVAAITHASDQVARMEDRFLIGPLGKARDDLADRLPRIRARAVSAEQGLTALMAFAGDNGPKRYLFLSQNPDEVRPTGGFIGTYGVLAAEGGQMRLERYQAIEQWTRSRPQADVPTEQAGSPFRFHNPPLRRTLGNVNAIPDWPQVAELAAELWKAGGEAPVDGVISFTPGFMARVLSVVGPVAIPSHGETVTAQNIHDKLDYYAHDLPAPTGGNPKDFVAVVAEAVMRNLLNAPASQWEPLATAMGQAFDAREAVGWSTDPLVQRTLADRGWDGAFPATGGDFVYNSEFQYVAKNGRGIRRTYDHHVVLRADGGARITTTLTVTNTLPPDPLNASTLAYMTLYGPRGAVLDQAASDAFGFKEPTLAGHPAYGWFRAAAPSGGQTTLKVVWDVPRLAEQVGNGAWEYSLHWLHLPDHKGDVVNLAVELPPAWRWAGEPPPAQFSLDRTMRGTWRLVAGD